MNEFARSAEVELSNNPAESHGKTPTGIAVLKELQRNDNEDFAKQISGRLAILAVDFCGMVGYRATPEQRLRF